MERARKQTDGYSEYNCQLLLLLLSRENCMRTRVHEY